MDLSTEEAKAIVLQFGDFLFADDLKGWLKSHPGVVNSTHHQLWSKMLTPFMFQPDQTDQIRNGVERLKILRRCIDVGVDLAFMGYG